MGFLVEERACSGLLFRAIRGILLLANPKSGMPSMLIFLSKSDPKGEVLT